MRPDDAQYRTPIQKGSPMTTNVPDRTTKRLAELMRGDWIHTDFEDFYDVGRVLHCEPDSSNAWGVRGVLLYSAPGDTGVHSVRLPADDEIRLLSDDEIADAVDTERRELMARQLAEVITLVRRKATPLPKAWTSVKVQFDFADDAGQLAEFAKLLGAEVGEYDGYGSKVHLTAVRHGDSDQGAGVDVLGQAHREKAEPQPEPVRELLAIAPSADGGVAFALAPAGAVVDPVARAKAVELTEAVAANPPEVETVHLLEPGSDGEDDDQVACGERVGDVDGWVESLDRVTCRACVAAMNPIDWHECEDPARCDRPAGHQTPEPF
jgi:hypothetical protein